MRNRFAGLAVGLLVASSPAQAACPIELAVYTDAERGAEIDFHPTGQSGSVTNSFRMILEKDIVLDGIVMWSEGVARPMGMLHHKCPEGDATGEELASCTVWQGVVYAVDDRGEVTLMPSEGKPAPAKLIFADLGPALATAFQLEKLPFDVFAMSGCQE